MPDDRQLFELVIHAEGEVRDAEGNLVSSEPIEARILLTEEQAEAYLAKANQDQQE